MVQVPTLSSVTVTPLTVQTVSVAIVAAKLTGRPELAVALSGAGVEPRNRLASGPKVMVWATGVRPTTKNTCVTGIAGSYTPLPPWLAVIEHVPRATSVIKTPETVQTAV